MDGRETGNSGKHRVLAGLAAAVLLVLIVVLLVWREDGAVSAPETAETAEAAVDAEESAQEEADSAAEENSQKTDESTVQEMAEAAVQETAEATVQETDEENEGTSGGDILAPEDFYRTTYEVLVYSFCDSNGDGIGDLPGLLSKLDYINDGNPENGEDLGMTGLWLMPVFPSPTYHKYDATDYMSIDPSYGTLEDLDNLVAACHERGMTLILDLAVNHTSTAHPWFQKAAEYLRALPSGQDAVKEECPYVWYYQFAREQYDGYVPLPDSEWYYEARFWSEMPDLNLTTPEVRQELQAVIDFWLDRGVDGFRLDAVTSYYTDNREAGIEFTQWFTETAKAYDPSAYVVGEAWTDQNSYAEYYRSGIDSVFDFAFAGRDGQIARVVRDEESLAGYVQAMAQEEALYTSLNLASVNAPFYSNHDLDRGSEYYEGDDGRRAKLAEALNLLMTGNAFIYYGEELGMKGSGKDENKRAPMYWSDDPQTVGMCQGPAGMDGINMVYGPLDKQKEDPRSIFSYVREAVRIRESLPVIARGRTVEIPELSEDRFCGFYRASEDWEDVLVLINTGDTAVTRQLPGEAASYRDLCGELYVGDERALIGEGEVTVPSGGIIFLKRAEQ